MLQVIALGNELRGDDGIGPRILEELEKHPLRERMKLINAAADAFIVLEYLKGQDPVVIIDCARMGRHAGEVVAFRADETKLELMNTLISLHGFGLSEIYRMAEALGPVAPCKIIGVEPESIDFNTGLSGTVEKSIPKVINLVIEEI